MITAIITVTAIWVALILCARFGYCQILRKHTRRVTCRTCKVKCSLYDRTCDTSKACDTYSGPERRRTVRIAGSRDKKQGGIDT